VSGARAFHTFEPLQRFFRQLTDRLPGKTAEAVRHSRTGGEPSPITTMNCGVGSTAKNSFNEPQNLTWISISELSKQLGYPTCESDIKERLNTILNSNDHIVYVAFVPNGKTIAWIHIYKAQRIESGALAEIGGFIVSESFRSKGIGKKLLEEAEKWSISKKLPKLRVRSKIEREDAKQFYSNMGFSISKKQRVFDKIMNKKA